MECRLRRSIIGNEGGIAAPTDLDAAEEIGFGARHLEQPRRLKGGPASEDLGIRLKAHLRTAPVSDRAKLFQFGLGHAAMKHHAVELLAARDLDFHFLRQGIDDGDAHTVESARRIVDLAVEFSA